MGAGKFFPVRRISVNHRLTDETHYCLPIGGSAIKIRSPLPCNLDQRAARLTNSKDFPREAGHLGPIETYDQRRVVKVAHSD
jgi:hypothetical protein